MPLFWSRSDPAVVARLEAIERKLDFIFEELGLDPAGVARSTRGASSALATDPRLAEVRRLIEAGEKLNAVVLYREVTGVGLKEAKDAVDSRNL